MQKILSLVLFLPFAVVAQHTLTVNVTQVESSEGQIGAAVYESEDGFLKPDKEFSGAFEETVKGTTSIEISDLPEGTYAVSIFHDENGNGKLDTNVLGIPKEPVAFSNAKMKTFGPPSFEECSFQLKSDQTITIDIRQ